MRKWGLIVTLFYAVIVMLLIFPACMVLAYTGANGISASEIRGILRDFYSTWFTWIWAGVLVIGQLMLLLVSVDVTDRRLRPRTSIVISVAVAGLLLALLTFAATVSVAAAVSRR